VTDQKATNIARRGVWARIGICCLNILQPGLGLVRLQRYTLGFGFFAFSLALFVGLYLAYQFGPQLTYRGFITLVVGCVIWLMIAWGGSILITWRSSAEVGPRQGWLWRWYGLLGVVVLNSALTSPLPDIFDGSYRNFYLPSDSMAPVLVRDDRIFAMMHGFGQIARGDVMIVRTGDVSYVKRVVALPGDTFAMRDGAVVLNGIPVRKERLGDIERDFASSGLRKFALEREQLPGEAKAHEVLDLETTPQDNTAPITLGPGQYVLLGDNRDMSLDSRFGEADGGIGVVDQHRISGRALFR
jgi:signal peptidase I